MSSATETTETVNIGGEVSPITVIGVKSRVTRTDRDGTAIGILTGRQTVTTSPVFGDETQVEVSWDGLPETVWVRPDYLDIDMEDLRIFHMDDGGECAACSAVEADRIWSMVYGRAGKAEYELYYGELPPNSIICGAVGVVDVSRFHEYHEYKKGK